MRQLLDDEPLEGLHEARITIRLSRHATALPPGEARFLAEVERLCAIWGGAVTPIIPVDEAGRLSALYARKIPGASIDGVEGLHPYDLFDLNEASVKPAQNPESVHDQLAVPLLKYKKADTYVPLEVVELEPSDPWRLIYAACLGSAPTEFDPAALRQGNLIPGLKMEDFVRVNRVSAKGSLVDLIERITADDRVTPRVLSMVHLAYGNSGSSHLRSDTKVLPEPWFPAYDAGPNIVVVCTPGNTDDAMLLWNLRGAHGDRRPAPIGLPLSEASAQALSEISLSPHLARNGFSAHPLYVTSTSLSTEQLIAHLGQSDTFAIADPESLLSFGSFGWSRDEVLVWAGGRSQFVPLPDDHKQKVLSNPALNPFLYFRVDINVADAPFPVGDDIRVDTLDGDIYGGSKTTWGMSQILSDVRQVSWPSRLLTARSIAARRGADLSESEPGRASRIAIQSLGDISYIHNLAHAPLLSLLEEMAARHGFGWYKQRMRNAGLEANPIESVGPTVDELPERSFGEFKRPWATATKPRATG
jgi:hypothetical protein